jgi:hypothetical protein
MPAIVSRRLLERTLTGPLSAGNQNTKPHLNVRHQRLGRSESMCNGFEEPQVLPVDHLQ